MPKGVPRFIKNELYNLYYVRSWEEVGKELGFFSLNLPDKQLMAALMCDEHHVLFFIFLNTIERHL